MPANRIFVGMGEFTLALHWQVFGFCATLPDLENRTRLRCLEVKADYAHLMVAGSPYTLTAPLDRLSVVDVGNLSGMKPAHLREFYEARDWPQKAG